MVSVIIPSYNRGYCISRSVSSVLNQSYSDIELIIVDDGSVDDTEDVIRELQDERIRYIRLPENKGVSNARNIGMSMARGEYIAFQDSDDYWLPNKLEKQLACMEQEDTGFCYTYIKHILPEGGFQLVPNENETMDVKKGNIYIRLLWENMVGAPTLVMKRECYEKVGNFDTDMPALEDWDYVLRLAQNYRASFVPEALFEATYSEKSITRNILHRLMANCMVLGKYKKDMMKHQIFDYHVKNIIEEAQQIGIAEQIASFMEKCITLL